MKSCCCCSQIKENAAFAKCSKSKNGLQSFCKDCQKQYRTRNKEKVNAQIKVWRSCHPGWYREYQNNRSKKDISYKLTRRLRQRLYDITRDNQKAGSAVRDLGCSPKELKQHLEKLFYVRCTGQQMCWEDILNGEVHIDHITPLSKFNLEDKEQFLKAFHYSNLQPLWEEDNNEKYDKIPIELGGTWVHPKNRKK
jgi:hypothetical protein